MAASILFGLSELLTGLTTERFHGLGPWAMAHGPWPMADGPWSWAMAHGHGSWPWPMAHDPCPWPILSKRSVVGGLNKIVMTDTK